ncbi:MAG: hypothetical protein LBD18_06395 [Treponema sp.]|jgi:hypothetical protein|nr:hypothetical protein [Treponema sp.]
MQPKTQPGTAGPKEYQMDLKEITFYFPNEKRTYVSGNDSCTSIVLDAEDTGVIYVNYENAQPRYTKVFHNVPFEALK